MTDQEVIDSLGPASALALTIWGEARSEPIHGQIAVGCVVRNRLPHFAKYRATEGTYKAVCLAPNQFSCWIPAGGVANHEAVMAKARKMVEGIAWTDAYLTQALWIAEGIISHKILDNTKGATMYWAPKAMIPAGTVPSWAKGKPSSLIGDQLFLVG